jgi:hypothetical protein
MCLGAGLAAPGFAQAAKSTAPPPRVFGGATIQEIYRVLLDRDALLLESVENVIKQKDIGEGHVLISAGSVQECRFHYNAATGPNPVNVSETVKGPYEIWMVEGLSQAVNLTSTSASRWPIMAR